MHLPLTPFDEAVTATDAPHSLVPAHNCLRRLLT
jgi:hypothetical protein